METGRRSLSKDVRFSNIAGSSQEQKKNASLNFSKLVIHKTFLWRAERLSETNLKRPIVGHGLLGIHMASLSIGAEAQAHCLFESQHAH